MFYMPTELALVLTLVNPTLQSGNVAPSKPLSIMWRFLNFASFLLEKVIGS